MNKITFSFQGHKFIVCSLTPQQIKEDEIKLNAKIHSEKENEKNNFFKLCDVVFYMSF